METCIEQVMALHVSTPATQRIHSCTLQNPQKLTQRHPTHPLLHFATPPNASTHALCNSCTPQKLPPRNSPRPASPLCRRDGRPLTTEVFRLRIERAFRPIDHPR